MDNINIFEKYLFEAPGDEDQDTTDDVPDEDTTEDNPPDMDDAPPDMSDDMDDSPPDMMDDDTPPDMNDTDDMGNDDENNDDYGMEDESPEDVDKDGVSGLDDKVSAILNSNLYQKFLSLISQINSEQHMTKNNMDVLYTISPESIKIIKSLNKLDENIRLYLKQHFEAENYSKNLLFFNKSLNLLNLLNQTFDKEIHKGIKEIG